MEESKAIITTLKQALRSRRMTYADIARNLRMSEANIKRMFSTGRFTLERLENICHLIDMELSDLFVLHEASKARISFMSEAQECELLADTTLFLVFICVRNHQDFATILKQYHIEESTLTSKLSRLANFNVIEVLPGHRIKLRIAEDFRWIKNGPIEKFYEKMIEKEFIRSGFNEVNSPRLFLSGQLSEHSVTIINQRLHALSDEFTKLHRQDSGRKLGDGKNIGLLLAMREWDFSQFKPYKRLNDE